MVVPCFTERLDLADGPDADVGGAEEVDEVDREYVAEAAVAEAIERELGSSCQGELRDLGLEGDVGGDVDERGVFLEVELPQAAGQVWAKLRRIDLDRHEP